MARGAVVDENGVVNGDKVRVVNGDNVRVVNAGQKAEIKQGIQFPRAILQSRQKMTRAGMRYNCNHALVIWCPFRLMRPDIIVSVCTSVNKSVVIRDRWIPDEDSNRKVWGGAMAIFTTELDARLASNRFKEYSKDVCPMPFNLLVDLYIAAEIRYHTFGTTATRIQITGRKSFHTNNNFVLEMELHRLGDVEEIHYRNDVQEYGIICEVDYKYVAHALAAKTAMEGMYFKREGYLSVKLVDTIKVKHIIEYCQNHIAQWLKTTQIQEF